MEIKGSGLVILKPLFLWNTTKAGINTDRYEDMLSETEAGQMSHHTHQQYGLQGVHDPTRSLSLNQNLWNINKRLLRQSHEHNWRSQKKKKPTGQF